MKILRFAQHDEWDGNSMNQYTSNHAKVLDLTPSLKGPSKKSKPGAARQFFN